jgi:F-box-like
LQILAKIFNYLPNRDLQIIELVCKTFAEVAIHPSLAKKVCHTISEPNLEIFLGSAKERFRNVVLTRLNLENRAFKRLWKRFSGDIVDLTLDKCDLRGGTLRRMLGDATNLKVLKISGIYYPKICKWRAGDFKGLSTNVQKLVWNRSFMKDDVIVALVSAMPGIKEISLEGWGKPGYRITLPSTLVQILHKRLVHMKSLELMHLDVNVFFMFGSPSPLANMREVRLVKINTVPNDFLCRFSGLTTLSMKHVLLDDQTMAIVTGFVKLKSLELSGCELNERRLENFKNLQSLEVDADSKTERFHPSKLI